MKPKDLHERAMSVFDRVCDLPNPERNSVLTDECGDDYELRRIVEALLREDNTADPRLDAAESTRHFEQLAAGVADAIAADEVMPERIADYRIIRRVGEGGMGIIYEAEQESPKRRVALKVLRPGLMSASLLKRFQQEAHVLGQLQHPGIAHIHEAGLADLRQGRQPFFVMEYIDGERLDKYAKANQLDVHQRMELIARVCDAVQHAHQKGIIHRDLKPSNVLVIDEVVTKLQSDRVTKSVHHGRAPRPDGVKTSSIASHCYSVTSSLSPAQPKVLDFGIARVTDADIQTVTVQTEFGQLVGTLAYMSPEQVAGNSDALDTRCDVYALGVMLYELLVGKRPHELSGLSITEAARIICDDEPASVGTIDRSLRGDVETIVAKAMVKDRDRRYASAAEFAADIRRCLSHQPIDARPASTFYQLNKFAQRNKGLVAGVSAAFLMLVVALIGTWYGLLQANVQRDAANAANAQLRTVINYQSAMLKNVNVAEMGRRIMSDIKAEARANLVEAGDEVEDQLTSFEHVLSRVNATTIANRAIDASIMSEAVEALETVFPHQPVLRAELRSSMAEIYANIGLAEKSLAQARIEWETRRQALGDEHSDTLLAKQKIVEMLLRTGSFEAAETTARDLLNLQRRVLGHDHLDTLQTQHLLGKCLVNLTRPEEAVDELEDALNRLKATVGASHPIALSTQRELGEYFFQHRNFEKAREAYEIALREYESQLGTSHPDTLSVLGDIAEIHFLQNDFETALPFMERICNTLAESKGADHPDTLSARQKLANNLTEMGRIEAAEPIVKDTLERMRRVLGTDHPSTVVALSAALRLMIRLKRWDEAEAFGIEALAVARRTLGPDNMRTLDAGHDLAAVYLKSENHDAAVRQGEITLSEYQRALGPDHIRALGMQQTLAKIYLSAGKPEGANELLQEALLKLRADHAASATLAGTLGQSVTALVNLERGVEAEKLARELLAWCKQKSAGGGVLGRCHLWIARTQIAQAKYAEAGQSLTKAIDNLSGNVPDTYWAMTFAHLLNHVVAFRTGATDRPDAALAAYEKLVAAREGMRPEERNTILPEARRIMRNARIEIEGQPE